MNEEQEARLAEIQHDDALDNYEQKPSPLAHKAASDIEWRVAELQALVDASDSFIISGIRVYPLCENWWVRGRYFETRDEAIALARELAAKEEKK